jgi:beta-glucuronidase
VSIRFGLRRIEVHAGALWLNGERLQLRGYNRHEWHPNLGPCTPVLQMAADLQILRDLGCNFIRGSHYPQDQKFLDLCDELGFLVLEENLGWGQREKTFASAKWREDHAESLRAMVRASCNHPSVIIWGFLNEAGTDQDYPRAVIGETVATLRSLDASRPVTYATMFALDDKHLDLVDIISINTYPGWYACEDVDDPVGCIKPRIDRCIASIDERGFSGKPILISEIGAEALYGWRDAHNDFFTEEYQAKYLQTACQTALEHPRCCGIALWHFSDVRTYSGGRSLGRPRTFNNKGTLDEYRRPKTAYEVVRRVFGDYAKRAMSAVNMTACGAGLFLFL